MPPDPAVAWLDLLPRIPLSARVLLDVGCGRGELGAAYARLNPTARVLGIDFDAAATAVASGRLAEVVTADVEAEPLPFDTPGGLDCIIYQDVLHQLRDPWGLLRRHAGALSPNGVMVISVPNPLHWRVTERVLRGSVPLPRWLGLPADDIRQGLLDSGLLLCDVVHGTVDEAEGRRFIAALAPGLAALGIDPNAYADRSLPTGSIWRARKEPQRRMTVASTMLAPVGGVSHVRVVHPLNAIATDPLVSVAVTDRIEAPGGDDDSLRIFVLHRPTLRGPGGRATLRKLWKAGWLVVTEFDDHPDYFAAMQDAAQLSFRGAHAVQTTTKMLADVLRARNPEVAVFPNSIVALPEIRNFADPDHITIFFGALNREQDWRPLIPAINAVAAQAGPRLRFQVVHDRRFFDALATPHKTYTPTCDYDTYMRLLGGSEISLMPLSDNPFNRAKSDLKFIEAGACRVAALASNIVYGASIAHGGTGLLFHNPGEFAAHLLRLVALPEMARGLGDAARAYVARERMLAYQVAPRIAWYRSLWARREALTAALQDRIAREAPGG